MKKKNITIDDLAVMVQKGFQETTGHIAGHIDKRFNEVNKRLESLENGQQRIELRLDNACPVR